MSIVIHESDLLFGEYKKEHVFHIEQSTTYKSLGTNIRVIEFVLRHKNNVILMIEAKSSSPKPGNLDDFEDFIEEIREKFVHSVDLFFSVIIGRINDRENDMPDYFKSVDYSNVRIKMLLVINGHKINWLPPVSNALHQKLKRQIKNWQLELAVINHEQAKEYGLLKT